MTLVLSPALDRFRRAYGAHRATEGRDYSGADLLALPYLTSGPLARQWSVRARTFDAFMSHVVGPAARSRARPLRVLDLGAGNGWLSHRLAGKGHTCLAVDIRDDAVDGLGVAQCFPPGAMFQTLLASFDALPLPPDYADIAVFNAALHYATDLEATLAEAIRVVQPGGAIVILDTPFYAHEEAGFAMVSEKHTRARANFGHRAEALLSLPFIEFLTRDRLARASPGMLWRRQPVRYPLWYEARPVIARLRGQRPPSRFDLWMAVVA